MVLPHLSLRLQDGDVFYLLSMLLRISMIATYVGQIMMLRGKLLGKLQLVWTQMN